MPLELIDSLLGGCKLTAGDRESSCCRDSGSSNNCCGNTSSKGCAWAILADALMQLTPEDIEHFPPEVRTCLHAASVQQQPPLPGEPMMKQEGAAVRQRALLLQLLQRFDLTRSVSPSPGVGPEIGGHPKARYQSPSTVSSIQPLPVAFQGMAAPPAAPAAQSMLK